MLLIADVNLNFLLLTSTDTINLHFLKKNIDEQRASKLVNKVKA